MSTINAIDSNILNAVNGNAAKDSGTAEKLRSNFMTLLIAQLKNQDPLKPMENAELTSQLAQINTVSGIDSLNTTLQNINSQIEAGQNLQATALIGKGVMVPGDRILVGEDSVTTPFGLELDSPAAEVTVSIVDGAGQLMRSFDIGAMDTGAETFVWDGLMDDGQAAPGGAYKVVVQALSEKGSPVIARSLNYAMVTGISNGGENGPRLDLGGISEQVTIDDIRQIL